MTAQYDYGAEQVQPVKGPFGFDTPVASAVIVLGALLFLILIRRGFRGVNVGGVGVSVR